MADEQNFVDHTRPISIRFTADEAEFINENYERITDTTERVTNRDFFFSAVQKAVSRIAPKSHAVDVTAYTKEIETLKAQLQEALTDIEGKTAYIDEITQRNVELDQEVDRLNVLSEEYLQLSITQDRESKLRVEKLMNEDVRGKENVLIFEDIQPVEQALISEYARLMKVTPKVMLIDHLFIKNVWHGPGDYIPHLNASAKHKIREAFK